MLPSEFDLFVKYAIGLSLAVSLVALWRVRKRGPNGLFLVGGAVGFALLLYLLLIRAGNVWLYSSGFVVVACLVADSMARPKREKR
jgi:hypothetical protein